MRTDTFIDIDGAAGEGGGQVLRTALGLSVATGKSFRIEGIRAGRARPGLLRQHLTCVRAAAAVGAAEVTGDTLGSTQLAFRPTRIVAGEHTAAVGSAGSAMLVIQAVLPALLVADGPSRLVVEGGTHNPSAPPYDFVAKVFVPLLARMGARVGITLERHGFYPAGGGRVVVEVDPAPLHPIELLERGEVRRIEARALVSAISPGIGHRELKVLRDTFALDRDQLVVEEVPDPRGPGNAVLLEVRCDGVTELFCGFGERHVSAEVVATRVAHEARAWLDGGAPVGEHLADQLLIPMALAGGGAFRTRWLSSHTTTNIEGVRRFVPIQIEATENGVVRFG